MQPTIEYLRQLQIACVQSQHWFGYKTGDAELKRACKDALNRITKQIKEREVLN